jgi:hypothetical protein
LVALVLLIAILPCVCGDNAAAATKAEKTKVADELVKEALHREIYGRNVERNKLLATAIEKAPEFAPAMWHSGYVRLGNEWVKAKDVPQYMSSDRRLELYERQRRKQEDTVEGHLALAEWCRKMKLFGRELAHLTQVLDLDTNNVAARARLGFVNVDGRWIMPAELERQELDRREDARTFQKWCGRLENIQRGLAGSRLQRETAGTRLMEIRDPKAVSAIEAMLSVLNEQAALVTVQALAGMQAHQADLALARMAVFSPWDSVQLQAVGVLRERPLENFVPDMLDALFSRVRSAWQLYEGPGGRLMFRQVFVRESRAAMQQLVLEKGYRRIARPGGDRVDTLDRALTDVVISGQTRGMLQILQNQTAEQLNREIMQTLVLVTDAQIASQPQAWWKWWDEHTGTYRPDQKPIDNRYRYQEIRLVDRVAQGGQGTEGDQSEEEEDDDDDTDVWSCECLAAGTKIWTETGPKVIEQVQVGDMVLSQHPETGELAYKPVLRFTIRPASELVTLDAGKQKITTSAGHVFWVSGEGWVMARNVKPGTELHGLEGTVQLSESETAEFRPAYNVVVADFHTYFVGSKTPVLCHDNTPPAKTNAVVPGLIDQ